MLGGVAWVGWLLLSELLHAHVYTELTHNAVWLVGAATPLLLLRNYLNSIQQGLQTFKGANGVLAAEDVTTLLLVVPLLWGGEGSHTIVTAAVGGAAVSCFVAVVMLLRQRIWPWPLLHRDVVAEAIPFGLRGHIGRMANMLNWRLDTVILRLLASVEVVGYYAVASQVAELFRPLSQSITYVLRPLIASLSLAEARLRGLVLYRRVFAINLGLVLVMAAIGGPLILGCFGEAFAPAVPAFQILLIGLAAHGANGVLAGYNVGIGRPEFNTYTALAGLVATVAGNVLLIPPYGLIGAAIASSIAYSIKAITLMAIFLKNTGVSLAQLIGVKEYTPDAA
jgi:O-antigen/teichoic acid export membrane protein